MRFSLLPLVLVLATPSTAATQLSPARHHPLVAGIVAAGLAEYHYADLALDDDLSSCWLNSYLDDLDRDRSMFVSDDVADFRRWETKLDDGVRSVPPDVEPAFAIHAIYRDRVSQRVAWTRGALTGVPDLTDDEVIEVDRSELAWPDSESALQDVWRRELEEDWLRMSLEGDDEDAIRERLLSRMDRMELAVADTEGPDLLEGWLVALTGCYDPHTLYMKPFSADDFAISTSGSLEGIGAALIQDGDATLISEVLPGGPAQLSERLYKDDRIVGVAQGDDAFVDVVGMRLDKVVQLIRGAKGTTVRLQIVPAADEMSDRVVITLVRDRIDLQAVEPTMELLDQADSSGTVRKVAVIEVPAFVGQVEDSDGGVRPSTTERVQALLGQAKDEGADTVVIDLRENGGGLLDEAVALTGLFVDRGPVVQIRDGRGRIELVNDEERGRAWTGPLVVLTSPFSASASEIVAGALQDYGRAVVVGSETTYGKGTVQTVVPLDPILHAFAPDLAGQALAGVLKITFSQYYLPAGRSTQAEGVPADVVLPSPYDGRVTLEAERPHALPADRIPTARFSSEGETAAVVAELSTRSVARIDADPRFTAMREWRTWLDQRDERTTVSLNLETRKAERADFVSRSDALEAVWGKDSDPVREEGVAVAADLAELSS